MNVPKLRSKEFGDEWQCVHLRNIVERITRKNKYNESSLPLTISSLDGLVDQFTYFNKKIASKDMSNYYLLYNGDFSYNKSYSVGFPYGSVKRLDKYDKGALSSLYICFKPFDKVNSNFLVKYFETSKWHKEVSLTVAEGARNHGLLNVSIEEFFNTLHNIPSLPEQQKIANFLSCVDEKIENQKTIVLSLEQQKKGFMEKLFSRELRFKDENGGEFAEWESKRLIDICDYVDYRGKTPRKVESGILLITAKNVKMGYIDYNISQEYVAQHEYLKVMSRGLPQLGDVLITTEAPCGNIAQIDNTNIALAQRIIKYRGKTNIIINAFLKYVLLAPLFQDELYNKSTGGTVKGIKGSLLHQIKINIPTLIEQQKIANFLSTLDEKIEAEKQILTHWQTTKKALLQQMFI